MHESQMPAAQANLIARMTEVAGIHERLSAIERLLKSLLVHSTAKDAYTTKEFAELTQRSEFTIRRWCQMGRIHAAKRRCGRGSTKEWVITHGELTRYHSEGLLPVQSGRDNSTSD